MQQTVDAIFENGVFKPLVPFTTLNERRRVKLTVEFDDASPSIRDCIGIMPDADAKELSKIIADEFEKVNLDDWR